MTDDLYRELSALPIAEQHRRLREALPALSLRDRFTLLHRLGTYRHAESRSGAASSLRETAAFRGELPRIVADYGISSILDLPCGDFYWMSQVALDVAYTGADIVGEVVAANQRRHSSPSRRFLVLDAVSDALPTADLVICRDLLIHLSNADCFAVLRNVVASGAGLLATNHFADRRENPDILSGDFRPINLLAPPFSLPPPVRLVAEDSELGGGAFRDRAIGLWRVADLARHPKLAAATLPCRKPAGPRD